MNALLTVGYEGATLEQFISTLQEAQVTMLLDVREIALSRRKGFSKKALAEALADAGIEYRHERDLGSPKPIRHQLREDGDYRRYFKAFRTYLNAQRPLLAELADSLRGSVALMCFERDYKTCHRSAVAHELESLTGLTAKHLGGEPDVIARSRASRHPGQGISAA